MTKNQYDNLNTFPVQLVTITPYYLNNRMYLKMGEDFTGIRKETLGKDDYSIIDSNGHPHYYDNCELKIK